MGTSPKGLHQMSGYELLLAEIEIEILRSDRDQYIGNGGRFWENDSFIAYSVHEIDQQIAKLSSQIKEAA